MADAVPALYAKAAQERDRAIQCIENIENIGRDGPTDPWHRVCLMLERIEQWREGG